MQIASILNILSASPAQAALAAPGGVPAAGAALSVNGVPNTGSLADALVTQTGAPVQAQFASLLATPVAKTLVPTEAEPQQETTTDTTQVASIAVPPIGLYIDKPVEKVVLTKNDVAIDADASKKLIYADDSKDLAPASNNAIIGNEVSNSEETYAHGKVKLAGLETEKSPDADFAKAVANIIDQAKEKGAVKTENHIQGKVVEAKTEELNTKTGTEKSLAATTALTQPEQIATKIAAKVIGVKEEKIKLETDISAEMSAKLQDLDTQLRSRSYNEIKIASQNLATSPAEQVQLKISQALDTGINSIKVNLHPVELGAVDVDMETDRDGNTKIRILADRAETLQMLKHDSQHLVKSLSEIGVKTDSTNLEFSLRGGDQQNQNNFAGMQNNGGNNNQPNQQHAAAATANYSRFSNINEQQLTLSVQNKSLNILV